MVVALSAGSVGLGLLRWTQQGPLEGRGDMQPDMGSAVEQRHPWAWEDGENSPQHFLVAPSAPVSAFSPIHFWNMEQLSPETTVNHPRSHSNGGRIGAGLAQGS